MWAITGAGGFIGRHLTARLDADGVEYRALRGDVRDAAALRDLVDGADVVVHLAGYVHRRTRTEGERRSCWEVNEGGTAALVKAIEEEAPDAFLIFVSTANVYAPSDAPIRESDRLRPSNPYGESKLAAERIVFDGRVSATVLRPAMVFGPGAPGNLPKLIALVRRRVKLLFGGGANRKSLVPVEEVVDAILAVANDRELAKGRAFNVAGQTFTMKEINELIAEALGKKPVTVNVPRKIGTALGRMGETYTSSTELDGSALRALPSFTPRGDARERLRETVRSIADYPPPSRR